MTSAPSRAERGLTLTELMITTVIASIVMLGLVAFYMSSQGVWLDSSGQALTQREATQLMADATDAGHTAAHVAITDVNGSALQSITFYDLGGTNSVSYWWSAADQRVHAQRNGSGDASAVEASQVQRFAFRMTPDTSYVECDIQMASPEGQIVAITSGFRIENLLH